MGRNDLDAGRRTSPGSLWPRRLALLAVFVLLTLTICACGPLQRHPIPSPFPLGEPYGEVVREIRIEGNEHTHPEVILESLVTRVGRPYSREEAARDYDRLSQLGVFSSVVFEAEVVDQGTALTVRVDELGRFVPSVSFATTQENGVEIGPQLSTPNLLGRGTRARGYARFSGAWNAGFTLQDSWYPTRTWHRCCFTLEGYHWERDNPLDDFREGSDELSVQYLFNVTTALHLGGRFTYLWLRAQEDAPGQLPHVTLDADGEDRIPGLGLVMEYEARNLTSYPTRGWYVALTGMQHGGWLGGDGDYPRLELDARRYTELQGPRHSLAAYALVTLTGGEMGRDVPLHQDFHLGGTNSVRGWPLNARSGKSQWINTLEYRWTVLQPSAYRLWFLNWSMGLQLTAYGDVATAWDDTEEFRDQWIGGGGIGARLVMPPLGLIRFGVGVGRTQPGLQLQLHFGGADRAIAQKRRIR